MMSMTINGPSSSSVSIKMPSGLAFVVLTLVTAWWIASIKSGWSPELATAVSFAVASTYFMSRRTIAPILGLALAAIVPFLMFPDLIRQVDGVYYERFRGLGYDGMFKAIVDTTQSYISDGQNRARGSFLLFVDPLIHRGLYSEKIYIPFNFTILCCICILVNELVFEFLKNHSVKKEFRLASSFTTTAVAVSPTFLFFSNDLLKDQFSLFLVLISTFALIRKNYVFAAAVIVAAVAVRSYNPLIIAAYYIAIKPPKKYDYAAIVAIIFLMMVVVKFNLKAVINIFLSMPYLYVNPLPFKASNWVYPVNLITAQGMFYAVPCAASFLQIASRKLRSDGYDRLFYSMLICSAVIVGVGYNNTVNFNAMDYGIGQGGDNMTRKCMPFIPLVALQAGLALMLWLPRQKRKV